MKRRSPAGVVTHVAVPVEPVQGVEPSADFTAASRRLIARQDQLGRVREEIQVEGLGRSRLQVERTRVSPEELAAQEAAATVHHQADQARALAGALGFEARARAAGVMGRITPAMQFQRQQREAERRYVYPRPR